MKAGTLPEKYKKHRRIFWMVYLGSIGFIFGMTMLLMLFIGAWQELIADMAAVRAEDLLLLFVILFVYSILFVGFYRCMCVAQKESLERYAHMDGEEQRAVDRVMLGEMRPGEIFYTERYFLFRDKRRLFLWNILAYDEIIWAYLVQSFYQVEDMEHMMMSPMMRFTTIVLRAKDGSTHSIFMGNHMELKKRFPFGTILGYGREQKWQAKERQNRYAEYHTSIPAKRRAERRKNICVVAVIALMGAFCVGAYAFLESDYCDYLRKMRKADAAYAAEEYFDAWYYYKWAQELKPDSERAKEGCFNAFLGSAREGVEEGWLEDAAENYRSILEWHPENGELYLEAAEAELQCDDPMTAIAFLDMGIAAWEEGTFTEAAAVKNLYKKRTDILSRIRIESAVNYWANGNGRSEKFYDEAGNWIETRIYDEEGNEIYRTEYVYDGQGQCLEERDYDKGEPDGRVSYVYDASGNLTEEAWYDAADVMCNQWLHAYDAMGNETLYQEFRNGVSYYWYEKSYNENGNLLRYVEKDSDGTAVDIRELEYDGKGNEVTDRWYNEDGVLYWWSESTYGEDGAGGIVIEEISYAVYAESEPEVTREKTWLDANGIRTKYVVYDSEGNEDWGENWEYDANGQKIRAFRLRHGEIYEECEYTYDTSGRLLQVNTYGVEAEQRWLENQSTYTYDAAGNEVEYRYVTYTSDGGEREWVSRTEYRYVYDAGNDI